MKDIVIIDDEIAITTALQREIRLELGKDTYGIYTFNNPLDALCFIKENGATIFLVISDLRMNEMNGSAVLEHIRSENPWVQTILLTAYTDMDTIQRAVSSNLQSLIMKPWKAETLVEEIKKADTIWTQTKENNLLKSKMNKMLSSAGDFQKKLFFSDLPLELEKSVTITFEPLYEYHCGGDFFDIFPLDNNMYLFILGDIAGHGPKPAIVSGILKTAIETIHTTEPDALYKPDYFLTLLNKRFCSILSATPEVFAAMSAILVDYSKKTISLSAAGLPPAIFIRNKTPELIIQSNPVLGADLHTNYTSVNRLLLEGDTIIFYTDGLIESSENQFTISQEAIYTFCSSMENCDASSISRTFKKHLPKNKFSDDVTIISITIPNNLEQ